MFSKKTIKDINLESKRILLSVDYNVPGDSKGAVTSDLRIKASLPTINYLLDHKCSITIISHRGRPEGKPNQEFSLEAVTPILSKLLNKQVRFIDDCIGEDVQIAKQQLRSGEILLLENTRFHVEEENDDQDFAKQLAENEDFFVQEAFGNAHRKHASMDAITHFLPSIAGFLFEHEVDTITSVMTKPNRPLMAIIGGAKIADKIEILNKFIEIADFIAIGGAMANIFLKAEGIDIAKSMVELDDIPLAKQIINKAKARAEKGDFIFYLPQDAVVASRIDKTAPTRIVDWSTNVVADIESYPARPPQTSHKLKESEMVLDIGPFSGAFIAGAMQLVATVVWNGTMGVTETPSLQGPIGPFAHGSELVIEALLGQFGHKPFSVIGGGDTAGYLEERKLSDAFNHVSTGGGASLELMAGRSLPGLSALVDKDSGVQ
jgi:3-phosphoglycerate kinase